MKFKFLIIVITVSLVFSCGDDANKKTESTPKKVEVEKKVEKIDITKAYMDDKGIGPITSIKVGDLDEKLVTLGLETYKTNCTACHKLKKRYIGPALDQITKRRSPEWIMNMIINPELMIEKNALAKALITEYNAPMANQQMTEEQARAILEFFRSKDAE